MKDSKLILVILTYLMMIMIISLLILIVFPTNAFLLCIRYSILLFIVNNLIGKTIVKVDSVFKEKKQKDNNINDSR